MSAKHPAVAERIRDAIGVPAPRGSFTRLAEQLGTTIQTVSRWHSLQYSPDPTAWPAIEEALGLRTGTLKTAAAEDTRAPWATLDQHRALEAEVRRIAAEVDRLKRR